MGRLSIPALQTNESIEEWCPKQEGTLGTWELIKELRILTIVWVRAVGLKDSSDCPEKMKEEHVDVILLYTKDSFPTICMTSFLQDTWSESDLFG